MASRARSAAARKGWATRRARAAAASRAAAREHRKRSDASRKGWETRRRNQRKLKRGGRVQPPPKRKRRRQDEEPEEPEEPEEFAVSADYSSGSRGSAVTVQIAAVGPPRSTITDASNAVTVKINSGRSPKGWKVRIVDWRGPDWTGEAIAPSKKLADAWRTLTAPLALAEISVSPIRER